MSEIQKPIAIGPVFPSASDVKTASSCLVFLKLTLVISTIVPSALKVSKVTCSLVYVTPAATKSQVVCQGAGQFEPL